MPSIAQLERLLSADPDDPFAHYALAQEHANQGDHEAALTHYDGCLRLDPDDGYAYFHKARSLQALERLDDAQQTLRDGLARATAKGDGKAASEIQGYLAELGG